MFIYFSCLIKIPGISLEVQSQLDKYAAPSTIEQSRTLPLLIFPVCSSNKLDIIAKAVINPPPAKSATILTGACGFSSLLPNVDKTPFVNLNHAKHINE